MGVFAMLSMSSLCKFAVPIFFMISGALLIPKQETIGVLLKKRVFRFSLVILLFVLLQYTYYFFTAGDDAPKLGWTRLALDIYQGSWSFVLPSAAWFLYAYVGLLLTMPFLRLLADRITKDHIIYMISSLCILVYLIPLAYSLLTGCKPGGNGILAWMRFTTGPQAFLVYALLGHYVENMIDIKRVGPKCCIFLAVLICGSCMLSAISEIAIVQRTHLPLYSETLVTFMGLHPVICCAVYLLVKKLCTYLTWSPFCVKWIGYVGAATFTLFLTENILRSELSFLFADIQTSYLSSWGLALLVTLSGIVIGMVLKRIPLLNKII